MGKPKDAKIWNEDLVKALDARHQKAQREGKRDVHLWRTGRDQILAVRKDIYMYRSGNIVNLPSNLKKTVQRLCEDVIRGVKSVYPDGHVPTNQHQASAGVGNPSTPVSSTARVPGSNNPFASDHYMGKMKIRGGAFAILMAFRYSMTEVLTKRDICREAQKFSDEQMEGNYHAGRMYGSWSSMKTLTNRGLVKEQGYATYTPNGFRDRPHTYSLTRDGELFIDSLLASRPEAVEAARQAAGRDPRTPFAVGAAPMGTPRGLQLPTPGNLLSPILPRSSDPATKLANMEDDRAKLEEWLFVASVGDRKEFKVGKDRRLRLHKLCDTLQRHHPGLILTHGSSGNGRGRTLCIQLVSKSPHFASTQARARATNRLGSEAIPKSAHSESGVLARERAGLAAIKRQEAAMEDIKLKTAILESKKMSSKPKQQRQFHTPTNDGDRDLTMALQASLRESRRKTWVKRNIFATIDSSSDDDLPGPFMSPSPSRKRQRMISISEEDKKPAAKKMSREIFCIDSESDSEKKDERKMPALPSTKRRKNKAKKLAAKKRRGLAKDAQTPSSINLCESTDDDDEAIEIQEQLQEPIDLSSSQLSQDPEFEEENETMIDLSNSQLSQDPEFIDSQGVPGDDDDDIIIVEDGFSKEFASVATSKARKRSLNTRYPADDNSGAMLTVYIDNRERNRNATPRTLRNELTRHLSTGPLRHMWPQSLPLASVEEAKLDWGDIQYSIQRGDAYPLSKEKLGVSIERKRVNDLVQRSAGGDHFAQLFHMKENCSLSVLLIENDTRTAQGVTPYNAQDKDVFDPFDTTVRCEDDVYRMFGRILVTCDSIKFIQTRDEQGSLRAIGALGLMAIFAPPSNTKYLGEMENERSSKVSTSAQALSDQLKEGGIPWRMAKRIANVVGSPIELKAMYDSCCNENAKSQLLSHVISMDDQDDLKSSASGWSDAIYRLISGSSQSILTQNKTKLSGEAALLLHKELIDDHGRYLSIFHQGSCPEESLEQVLDNPCASPLKNEEQAPRYVAIALTAEQTTKYFPPCSSSIRGEKAFYKLSTISKDESKRKSGAIAIQAISQPLASKSLLIFEMEGSKIVDLVCDSRRNEKEKEFVSFAKTVARRVVNEYCQQQNRNLTCGANDKRILMVCGLQPALDANAKKSGYSTETKTLIDLIFAELMLCYDVTILQALRKKVDDRVNLVKQLALACYHCAFLTQITN